LENVRRLAPSLLALLLAWAAVTALLLLVKDWRPTRELWVVMLWGGWLLPIAWFGMVVPAVLLAPRSRPRWWPPLFAALGTVAGAAFTYAVLRLTFDVDPAPGTGIAYGPLLAAGAATGLLTALFHLRLEPREELRDQNRSLRRGAD
jgi:hypothetical protein